MGSSTYSTNWDGDLKQPRVIFHVTSAGSNALNWDDVTAGNITQDAAYVLEGSAVPFDPNAGWQNGDVLPRRIIKSGCGSRSDIKVVGQSGWVDGYWDVTLARAGHGQSPQDDKNLRDHGTYNVAFAIHRDATGGRWHYVSLPQRLGLAMRATSSPRISPATFHLVGRLECAVAQAGWPPKAACGMADAWL